MSFNLTPIWGYFRAMSGLLYSIKISESLKGLSELHTCNTLILLHICSKSKRKSLIRFKAENMEQLTFNQWVTGSNPVRLTTVFNDLAGIRRAFWFLSARHGARQKRAKLRNLTLRATCFRCKNLQRVRARAQSASLCMQGWFSCPVNEP